MSGMSAWVTSDTTRWRRAVTGSVRKSMAVTPDPPRARGLVSDSAPDKTVRLIVPIKKLESLTIDAIAHRDETDQRIVQQLGVRALLDRNSLRSWPANEERQPVGRVRFRKSSARPNPRQTLHQGLLYRWAIRWGIQINSERHIREIKIIGAR